MIEYNDKMVSLDNVGKNSSNNGKSDILRGEASSNIEGDNLKAKDGVANTEGQ